MNYQRCSVSGLPGLAPGATAPLAALLLFGFTAAPVRAQAVFGNFGVPTDTSVTGTTLDDERRKSVRFTTGANSVSVTSVQASLSRQDDFPASVVAGIFSNNGSGNPGALLFGFNTLALPSGGPLDFTLTPSGAITLAPNTTYHLQLTGADEFPSLWYATTPAGTNPSAQNGSGIVFESYRFSIDNGATWTASTVTNRFQINGTVETSAAAPEPGSLALVMTGGITTLAWLRRKR